MKKFYAVAIAICLFITLQSTSVFAQTTFPVSGSRTFTVSGAPNPCTNCVFNVSGAGTIFTIDVPVTLVNSTINVTGNTQLVVNANLTLQNSQIIIGDINSTTSTANVFIANNANIRLSDANSKVRVGNVNNYISGGAGGGGATPGQIQAQTTISILGFTFKRYLAIYSGNGSSAANPYNLNCNGSHPNSCKNGFVYGPVINSQTSIANGFIVFTAFGTDSPLPVVLGSFSASLAADNSVSVNWTTEQEVNSSYFSVERSSNGSSDFKDIGTVSAKGNSAIVSNYSFTDNSAENGVNYYRLKMVDLDGSFVYSQVSVVNSELVQNIRVFPNPATNFIYITLGGSVPTSSVRLIDLTGKILQEQRLNSTTSNSTISMPVSNYAHGIYILQAIKADGTKWNTKVTIGSAQ
jgi:hypothetical protein